MKHEIEYKMKYGVLALLLTGVLTIALSACNLSDLEVGNTSAGYDYTSAEPGSESETDTGTVQTREKLNQFTVTLGEPRVVVQGPSVNKVGWGPYQFPALAKLNNGMIVCSFSNRPDSNVTYVFESDIPNNYVSTDNGETWTAVDVNTLLPYWPEQLNFTGAQNAYTDDWLTWDWLKPVYQSKDGKNRLYYALKLQAFNVFGQTCPCYSFDGNGNQKQWTADFIWKYMPAVVEDGLITPFCTLASAAGSEPIRTNDGNWHFALFSYGFNNETGQVENGWHYNVYVFKSEDEGLLWEYESQVLTTAEYTDALEKPIEGFCEPFMNVMPDGSVVMLMRTDAGSPSYITRSTDNCKTWSKPAVFDDVGVLPQMLTLDCGVTLASYGRPGIFVRATDDPSGQIWQDRVDVGIKGGKTNWSVFSCSYTSLIPLDSHTALLAYSDFQYPDAADKNKTAKTILVRTVTVTYPDETAGENR